MELMKRFTLSGLVLIFALGSPLLAESQDIPYKGVTDPFGDPSQYEFADDEKEDKEFFHLGRFLMIGIDLGVGIYTGDLGQTVSPGAYGGAHLLYFFDKSISFEVGFHYGYQTRFVSSGANTVDIDIETIPITGGFRYYFDIASAPKAIAIANPYLAAGAGIYTKNETVIGSVGTAPPSSTASDSAFGGYLGAGVEFDVYHRHFFVGLDLRYHLVFSSDQDTASYLISPAASGDFFTSALTMTYSF